MRRFALVVIFMIAVVACDKHDPILPGVRTDIFNSGDVNVRGDSIPKLAENIDIEPATECPYRRDDKNNIWNGERKVFAGFPTANSVRTTATPVCSGVFVYSGLSTGELVKINPATRSAVWVADIFRPSNMTGGASLVDIVVSPVVYGKYVYAGGLGDALCKISASTGAKQWCTPIGVAHDFIVTDNALFVVATDGNLYAIDTSNGDAYWRTSVKKQLRPTYANKIITVGRERFNAENGDKIK